MAEGFGVNENGFLIKRKEQTVEDLTTGMEGIFGPSLVTDPESREGQFIDLFADAVSEVWEVALSVYNDRDITTSQGANMDLWAANLGRRARNTDELDDSYRLGIFASGELINPIDFLQSQLADVADVTDVYIRLNKENQVDASGIPPNSFAPVIEGGDVTTLAETIWDHGPGDQNSVGDVVETITDANGFCREVRLRRPSDVNIFIEINATTYVSPCACGLPTVDEIKAQAVTNLTDTDNTCPVGKGETVYLTQVSTAFGNIPGVKINSLTIGKEGETLEAEDIPLMYWERAIFNAANITVTLV